MHFSPSTLKNELQFFKDFINLEMMLQIYLPHFILLALIGKKMG